MGDQNSDPLDGDSVPGAIDQLLDSPWIRDPRPTSAGAVEAAQLQGGANLDPRGDPRVRHGGLQRQPGARATCVQTTSCRRAGLRGAATPGCSGRCAADPLSRLTGEFPFPTSDHRLVWVDLRLH